MRELLKQALNHKLRKVIGSTYMSKSQGRQPDKTPIDLWLEFEQIQPIRIHGSANGAFLLIDQLMPEPSDMDDAGEIIIYDASKAYVFRDTINSELRAVSVLVEAGSKPAMREKNIVGIRFDFGLNIRPIVLNWGDELYLGLRFPPDSDEAMFLEVPIQ